MSSQLSNLERLFKEGQKTIDYLFANQIKHIQTLKAEVTSQNQALSAQMSSESTSITQTLQHNFETLTNHHRTAFIQLTLQSQDASRLFIRCQHPVLYKHQFEVESFCDPNRQLLDSLVAHNAIKPDERCNIMRDVTTLGKIKRILFYVDGGECSKVKELIEALSSCRANGANCAISEILCSSYHEYIQKQS